jgi:hypothetical protein
MSTLSDRMLTYRLELVLYRLDSPAKGKVKDASYSINTNDYQVEPCLLDA